MGRESEWRIDCPACRKPAASGDEYCRRCGCDLGLLQEINRAAAGHYSQGCKLLATGNASTALEAAQAAWRLRRTPAIARLAWLAALMAENYYAADIWWQRTAA